jgi:hypothetical protein
LYLFFDNQRVQTTGDGLAFDQSLIVGDDVWFAIEGGTVGEENQRQYAPWLIGIVGVGIVEAEPVVEGE